MQGHGGGDRSRGFLLEPLLVLALVVGLLLAHAIGSAQELGMADRLRLGAALAFAYGIAATLISGIVVAIARRLRPDRAPHVAARFVALVALVPCALFVLASALDVARVRRTRAISTASEGRLAAPPFQRLLLVGAGGITLDRLAALRADGRLPTLDSLATAGSIAPLDARAFADAPSVWTSVVTGVPPAAHGVRGRESIGFVGLEGRITGGVPPGFGLGALIALARGVGAAEPMPVTAEACRVPRLWDLVDGAGLASLVVGWWATGGLALAHGEVTSDLALREAIQGAPAEARAIARAAQAQALEALERDGDPALVSVYFGEGESGAGPTGAFSGAGDQAESDAWLEWLDGAVGELLASIGSEWSVLLVGATSERRGEAPGVLIVTGNKAGSPAVETPEDVHALACELLGLGVAR